MQKKKAQILLITLLVLTILAIITVSLVVLVGKDSTQVVSSSKYEQAYNTSESQLNKILDKYKNPTVSLTGLINDFGASGGSNLNCLSANSGFTCTSINSDFSSTSLTTKIDINETPDIDNFKVNKDDSFDINLNGYSNSFQLSWDKDTAMDFALVYKDAAGNYQIIRDVFDPLLLLSSFNTLNDQPYNDIGGIHPFNFKRITGGDDKHSVEFNIGETVDLNNVQFSSMVGVTSVSLRITPRMANQYDSINLNAKSLAAGLPKQIRVFDSKSYDANDPNTPVANIETKVPLYSQANTAFDYALITNGVITNN